MKAISFRKVLLLSLTSGTLMCCLFVIQVLIVLPTTRSILQNTEDYPEPQIFDPSRFLKADGNLNHDVKDPATVAFGFGRRVCVSIYLERCIRLLILYSAW